ncbi:MAG: mechanosensitive ion channel [Gammaproteobacteria bacterium]|nr:mechanosensitive ion channel [Gammaproteobacteria bacterium]
MNALSNLQDYLSAERLTEYVAQYGASLLFALLIFLIGKRLARWGAGLSRTALRRAAVDETLVSFAGNLVHGILLAFVIIATLSKLGIETTSIAAIFAAAGLAIGLALQGSLSNFASGVLIIAFRPFKVGNYVEIAGTAGTVEEVSIFTTRLLTPDNKSIIVPNASITSDNIINYSAKPTRRLDLVFGIGYDDDLKKAKAILEEIIAADDRVMSDPQPVIAVLELADSSVNFAVRPWVSASDYWALKFDLTEAVKLRFDAEGISIPFPQRDVHLHQVAA